MKEAKFRTEALKQKSFLKYSQQVFCTCSFFGNLSEDTRRILQLLLSCFWKIQEVQSEQKRRKRNMLSSSERSVRGLAISVKEEKNGYYISKWTRVRYTLQFVSVRLDIKVFTMLLVYYKTLLAFSMAIF